MPRVSSALLLLLAMTGADAAPLPAVRILSDLPNGDDARQRLDAYLPATGNGFFMTGPSDTTRPTGGRSRRGSA